MTLYDDLLAEGLPVISVSDKNEITMGTMTDDQKLIYDAVLLQYFHPNDYPDVLERRKNKRDIALLFPFVLNKLKTYSTMTNATAADLQEQAKFNAKILRQILLVLQDQFLDKKP